jgi:hypothetical protein
LHETLNPLPAGDEGGSDVLALPFSMPYLGQQVSYAKVGEGLLIFF